MQKKYKNLGTKCVTTSPGLSYLYYITKPMSDCGRVIKSIIVDERKIDMFHVKYKCILQYWKHISGWIRETIGGLGASCTKYHCVRSNNKHRISIAILRAVDLGRNIRSVAILVARAINRKNCACLSFSAPAHTFVRIRSPRFFPFATHSPFLLPFALPLLESSFTSISGFSAILSGCVLLERRMHWKWCTISTTLYSSHNETKGRNWYSHCYTTVIPRMKSFLVEGTFT